MRWPGGSTGSEGAGAAQRLRRFLPVAAATLTLSACAYFNSLYNAKRLYSDARRAVARGDATAANAAYDGAIAKAAASYRRDSTGRWSNEALELIGRSYFGMGDDAHARAAFERLLERGVRGGRAAAARAYLGAALVRSGEAARALPPLDSAAARLGPHTELGAFARLWRARARFAAGGGRDSAAWADLAAAGDAGGAIGADARMEAIRRAVLSRDSVRAAAAFAAVFRRADLAPQVDSVQHLARAAAATWGPLVARRLLTTRDRPAWSSAARLQLRLFRAGLAAEAGDTATALTEAGAVAEGADRAAAAHARVTVARWRLASARDLAGADGVRGELLPAVADPQAQKLIQSLKILDVLVERAPQGEPVALFAAGELARDRLGAPILARRLFVTYADLVPTAPWAPKALLAAASLAPPPDRDSLRERLRAYSGSIYVRPRETLAADSAFADAEQRLAHALAGATEYASAEAARRDAGVTRVVAVLDSIRNAARTDSLRIACGAFADSAGIAGVRGDSLRAACVRGDSAKVALLLKADTMKRAGGGTLPAALRNARARDRGTRPAGRDTSY